MLFYIRLHHLLWNQTFISPIFCVGYDDINAFKADLELARSTFRESSRETPQGQDIGATADTTILPIGVGFLGWILDESSDSSEKIKVALEARVTAVWFSFGTDLEKWITFVRKYDSERTVPHKTLVFVLVNSLEEALKATEQWKVDVLIVQSMSKSFCQLKISLTRLLTL